MKLCSTNEAGQRHVGIRLNRRAVENLERLQDHFKTRLERDVSPTLIIRLGLAVLRRYLDSLLARGDEVAAQALALQIVREIR